MTNAEMLKKYLAEMGLKVSPGSVEQMVDYVEKVISAPMNLTAIKDPAEAMILHAADSLTPLKAGLVKGGMKIIDVGTGGGFPAVPIALARREISVTAIDSTGKKIDFINSAISLPNLVCVKARAEELSRMKEHRAVYDAALARAVASLDKVFEYLLPFVKPGGVAIAYKAQPTEEEMKAGITAACKHGASGVKAFRTKLKDTNGEEITRTLVVAYRH